MSHAKRRPTAKQSEAKTRLVRAARNNAAGHQPRRTGSDKSRLQMGVFVQG